MLSLHAAAAMTAGRVVGDGALRFARVNSDSRVAAAGDLFVAIEGERFDGHDFIASVLAQGAAAVLARRLPEACTGPAILVEDTRRALADLAAGWRRRFALPVIAVTGSNGKTTVKEMIAAILGARFGEDARLATAGNLNNDIGVPLTTLRLGTRHRAAVIELGMNHPGEIIELARVAQPGVALVNNAQREHQEFMASVDAVAHENGAVFTALPPDGTAVFPFDSPYVALWSDLAEGRRRLTFGLNGGADVIGASEPSDDGMRVRIDGAVQIRELRLQTVGTHNLLNALAAAACAHAAGVDDESIARGLAAFAPVKGRLQRKRTLRGALVIDDTYNANPDSVRAAIDVLAAFPSPRTLVLGDMGEVGDHGPAFHAEVGAHAKARGIERVIATGDATRDTVRAFGGGGLHCADVNEVIAALSELSAKDTVLVKGSRFMRMERVVAALVEADGAQEGKRHAA